MADEVARKTERAVAFDSKDFQRDLLRFLYQHLVRYTELTVRHAVKLDHAPPGCDDSDASHPLLASLSRKDESTPLDLLLDESEQRQEAAMASFASSSAAAYLVLTEWHGQSMFGIARYLKISTSYAYRCAARVRESTKAQYPMAWPGKLTRQDVRPWRRERATRAPHQFTFDFDDKLPFPFVEERDASPCGPCL